MVNLYGMQFIVDASGNYYRTNKNNQLVVASNKEEASVFTMFEANQRIGGGKKSSFYFTIPVENTTETEEDRTQITNEYKTNYLSITKNNVDNSFEKVDIENIHWLNYLLQFCHMASTVGKRSDELANELSEVDKKICDIMHLIELYDLTQEEELHTVELLKEIRQRRREIKDEISCLEYFRTSLGTEENVTEAKNTIKQIQKMSYRVYRPRVMTELFEGMEGRETGKDTYFILKNQLEKNNSESTMNELKGEEDMEYTIKETIYDNKRNDWMMFAREQLDFYKNIPQYMVNLKLEIEAIDSEIEETLLQTEDANYNVAQGYKVFKELKDLRNERKEKQKELNCLQVIVEGMNCKVMQEMYESSVSKMEDICGEKEKEAYSA